MKKYTVNGLVSTSFQTKVFQRTVTATCEQEAIEKARRIVERYYEIKSASAWGNDTATTRSCFARIIQ